jgi:hypothetical protein
MAKKVTRKKSKASRAESKEQVFAPPYARDLEDIKSVRTSFRLSQEGSAALVWLAEDAKVKLQGVLTHLAYSLLMDRSVRDTKQSAESEQGSILNRIRQAASDLDPKTRDTSARKTYVVDKLVLQIFNGIAKAYHIPRDLLVDLALKIKKAERQTEADSLRKHYEDAMREIDELLSKTDHLKKHFQEILGEDDPIVNRLGLVAVVIMNLSLAIESNLKERIRIDPEDYSQSC